MPDQSHLPVALSRYIENTAYSSPPPKKSGPLAPLLPGAALPFYLHTFWVIFKYSGYARRGALDRQTWMRSSLEWTDSIEACGGRIEISGREHLRSDKPTVLVGNHMSTAETFLLPGLILPFTPLTFVIKESLLKVPFFGSVMQATQPITVLRENSRADLKTVITDGMARLEKGISVVIFPQSTRSKSFDPSKFNSLGAKLASRSGAPIIPFAVKTDFWSNGKWIKDIGWIYPERTVKIAFGPVIPEDTDAKTAQGLIVDHVRSQLDSWGVECKDG